MLTDPLKRAPPKVGYKNLPAGSSTTEPPFIEPTGKPAQNASVDGTRVDGSPAIAPPSLMSIGDAFSEPPSAESMGKPLEMHLLRLMLQSGTFVKLGLVM